MFPALNQNAHCACSLGLVILKACRSSRTSYSAGNSHQGTQPQMTWTQGKMGTSTPGLPTLCRRIKSSRHSSASSWIQSCSCCPNQARLHPNQQMQVPCTPFNPQVGILGPVPKGQVWEFLLHPGCSPATQPLGYHQGANGHHCLVLQGNPQCHPGQSSINKAIPLALPIRQVPTIEAHPQHPWASPVSPSRPGQGKAPSLQLL